MRQEEEAAAAVAIMGLIWAAPPGALLAGLAGFATTEALGMLRCMRLLLIHPL